MRAIRRRFRLPVLSRLTIAWIGAFGVVALVAGGVGLMLASGRGPARVSLPVDRLEVTARPEAPAADPESPRYGVKLAAPGLREGDAPAQRTADAGENAEENDLLAYPDEFDMAAYSEDETGGDIVITIPGTEKPAAAAIAASPPSLRNGMVARSSCRMARTAAPVFRPLAVTRTYSSI